MKIIKVVGLKDRGYSFFNKKITPEEFRIKRQYEFMLILKERMDNKCQVQVKSYQALILNQ